MHFRISLLHTQTVANGPPSAKFTPMAQTSSYATACAYFDNLELDIFVAGGPQCHFITSVTTAGGIQTLSGH